MALSLGTLWWVALGASLVLMVSAGPTKQGNGDDFQAKENTNNRNTGNTQLQKAVTPVLAVAMLFIFVLSLICCVKVKNTGSPSNVVNTPVTVTQHTNFGSTRGKEASAEPAYNKQDSDKSNSTEDLNDSPDCSGPSNIKEGQNTKQEIIDSSKEINNISTKPEDITILAVEEDGVGDGTSSLGEKDDMMPPLQGEEQNMKNPHPNVTNTFAVPDQFAWFG